MRFFKRKHKGGQPLKWVRLAGGADLDLFLQSLPEGMALLPENGAMVGRGHRAQAPAWGGVPASQGWGVI